MKKALHTSAPLVPMSRRRFLQRVGALGAAGTLLASCGPDVEDDPELGAAEAAEDLSCLDVTGLTDMEVNMRETLAYVDDSPYEDKLCNNCQFWQPPAVEGTCGGCQLIRGPIHPLGYCNSWAPQQAPAG